MAFARVSTIALVWVVVCGCAREPADTPCPPVGAGELVLTEIRGPQSGDDGYGEWLEIYNASPGEIDLAGLALTIFKLDGSSESHILVRRHITVAADGYAVVGRQLAGQEPAYVDYGYITDFDRDLYDSGAIELSSCGQSIDITVYRNLPTRGTLVLDGDLSPTADLNDDEAAWCVDAEEDAMSPTQGIRGTPRERNRSCSDS